jgi:hypothetical protein
MLVGFEFVRVELQQSPSPGYIGKCHVITNATMVDTAIKFVSDKSTIKSQSVKH